MGSTMMALKCVWCDEEFEKMVAEVTRQMKKGKTRFFCSSSHAAKFRNAIRKDRKRKVTKICPSCDESFETMTGAKSATFCSRSCASSGSVTEARRQAGREAGKQNAYALNDIEVRAKVLRKREAWKYRDLQHLLVFAGEEYQFEFALPETRHIFDLALVARKVLVEFDGAYHASPQQAAADVEKTAVAEEAGWRVVRIATPVNQVIEASVLYPVLQEDDN